METKRFTQADLFKLSNSYLDNYAVAIPQSLIHFTKDYSFALIVSQLLYWSDKTKNPEGYVYKTDKEWNTELGVTRRTLELFRKVFNTAGWIESKLKKANGYPTHHYQVQQKFFDDYELFLKNRQEEIIKETPNATSDKRKCNKLQKEMLHVAIGNATSDNSITYNTTYNTAKNTTYIAGENISKNNELNNKDYAKYKKTTPPAHGNITGIKNDTSNDILEEYKEADIDHYENEDSLPYKLESNPNEESETAPEGNEEQEKNEREKRVKFYEEQFKKASEKPNNVSDDCFNYGK